MLTLTPEFFEVVEREDLAGEVCAECNEPFNLNFEYTFAYKARVNTRFIEKGNLYHPECLDNFVSPREKF